METVIITEGQRNELCSELARLTFEFRKDKNVFPLCDYLLSHTCKIYSYMLLITFVIQDSAVLVLFENSIFTSLPLTLNI